ncbi:hypothetical protein PV327_002235 [Microctonus hyperodae]|uniref:Uncharacterized protein n=1 Tax=Microctonus hyperodae TaxID=165561 RepID=A0AA39FF56_MICHY|nr:hypothetical protein PV327_002235 [Microctonus hyperodae]
MKMRVSCCSLIYRKALKLSNGSLAKTSVGQAVNLLSNDVGRFDLTPGLTPYIIIGPLQAIIITYIMYQEVGLPAVYGVIVLLILIPLQGWIGRKSSDFRLSTAIKTDARIHSTNEVIRGIQAIKMYTWEYLFSDRIAEVRKREINVIKYIGYIKGSLLSFMMFTTKICLLVTIVPFVLSNEIISTEKVFVLTAFYTALQQNMAVFFPYAISFFAELLVSVERLQKFLLLDEIDLSIKYTSDGEETSQRNEIITLQCKNLEDHSMSKNYNTYDDKKSLILENVHAKWLESDREDTLHSINIKIEPGQLVAIVGPVGSGKSSLMNVILKELTLSRGKMSSPDKIAYASQDPWLFSSSVVQNILFGRPMDQQKYNEIIDVCQLKRDLILLPYGDKTLVGERGAALSGGQRARINLARAVYADASLYLFDDPLSAVDAHVSKNIFDQCISKYLRGRTRILVTHQIQFLRNVDKIIVLKDGGVEAEGTYEQLTNIGMNFGCALEEEIDEGQADKFSANVVHSRGNSQRRISHRSITSTHSSLCNDKTIQQEEDEPVEIEEIKGTGNINNKVYLEYLKAFGHWSITFSIALLFIAAQLAASGCDWFLAYWIQFEERQNYKSNKNDSITNDSTISTANLNDEILSTNICIYILSGLTLLTVLLSFIRSIAFFSACMQASIRIHNNMFRKITRATMYFFNTTPSGRILNRFSKDMGAVDELLPVALINTLQLYFMDVSMLCIISISNPWLIIPTVVMAIIFYLLLIIYSSNNRDVKRLEGVARSPIYSHFSATLQGLTTVRSFKADKILIEEFDRHQDFHSGVWFIFLGMSQGFGIWLDLICVIYILLVTMSFLIIQDDTSSVQGANVGLAITQSLGLIGMFQWLIKQNAEFQSQLTSMERVMDYANLESEPPLESLPDIKPPSNWPYKGTIEFKHVYLSYSPMESPVLKDLNFTIESRERIGIVGRTGAGKSSLISVLFRLAEVKGDVEIDGVNISRIGLHDLRSNISIIPQEPFLFSGTLRKNIDPFQQYDDEVLWSALKEVELKELRLEDEINDGGSNLSVGQRQLICLARAIVKKNKILVLDEATANVDMRTDEFIQKTIRDKFSDCTVLTIAHRLNTIMDSDRILVMDAGNVVEFDHPHVLLKNKDSFLSKMVMETGPAMTEDLTEIAKESYYNNRRIESSTKL